jgi:hypothetical protein
VDEKHDIFYFLKKNNPNPFHIFGGNIKTSSTGKFTTHVVKGVVNSNSLKNSSYGKDSSCQGRIEWSPRRYLDMRDMCSISISSNMTFFKRHLLQ